VCVGGKRRTSPAWQRVRDALRLVRARNRLVPADQGRRLRAEMDLGAPGNRRFSGSAWKPVAAADARQAWSTGRTSFTPQSGREADVGSFVP